jgi:sugar phosphate isomerase/epimerase
MPFSINPTDFFVNAPFIQLQDHLLDLFIEHNLQPEIGLEGDLLYTQSIDDFQKVADKLQSNNLGCTLHAPFFDLSPGALDHKIREVTRNKLHLAFDLIPVFKPKAVVCHLNFESNKHGYKHEAWFKHAKKTWQELLTVAEKHDTPLMLENTYEESPEQHLLMLEALDSPLAKFCFDTGHVISFADSNWQQWQAILNNRLGHLHLHDNDGDLDSHLAIGRGKFDFAGFFNLLSKDGLHPTVTIEPHSLDDLWESLETLQDMGVLPQSKNNQS